MKSAPIPFLPFLVLTLFLLVVPFWLIGKTFVVIRRRWGGKLDLGVDYEIRWDYIQLEPVFRIRRIHKCLGPPGSGSVCQMLGSRSVQSSRSLKKRTGSGGGSVNQRCDPRIRIRIRNKMLRIRNTGSSVGSCTPRFSLNTASVTPA